MTAAEVQETIATALDWSIQDTGHGKAWHLNGIMAEEAPPNYLTSLDACYEMERSLPRNLQEIYYQKLKEEVSRFYACWDTYSDGFKSYLVAHAAAPHRCRAFCKVYDMPETKPKTAVECLYAWP